MLKPLLLVGLPLLELMLLVRIGAKLGGLLTLMYLVVASMVGMSLARAQGAAVMERLRGETVSGRAPATDVLDRAGLALAGLLIAVPGFFTDFLGVLLLVPAVRRVAMLALLQRLKNAAVGGGVRMHMGGMPRASPFDDGHPGTVRDAEVIDVSGPGDGPHAFRSTMRDATPHDPSPHDTQDARDTR